MDANMYGVPAGRKKGNQINGSCQPVTSNWLAPRGKSHHLCHRMAIFYVFLTLNCQLFEKMQWECEIRYITKKSKVICNYQGDWWKPGQSSRGVSRRRKHFSKVPAHASLLVRKFDSRLNSFFTVAGIEECSNCEYGVGPSGSWITAPNNQE
jgi:hypothetical protein